MSQVIEAVDVDVPVHTAYNQWTQFESFPEFMDGVEQVSQLDWEPKGVVEKVGAAVGLDDHQVKADAKRFKAFIEGQRGATGAWRGDVPSPTT